MRGVAGGMRRLPPRGRHRRRRLSRRPGRRPVPARGSDLRYADLELRVPDGPPPGQLDLTGTGDDSRGEAARGRPRSPGWSSRSARPSPPAGCRRSTTASSGPWCGCWPGWNGSASGSTRPSCAPSTDELTAEVRQLERRIQDLAGEEFEVNSTPQLRQMLFDRLGLQPQKKTKTGYSTDAAYAREAARRAPDHRGAPALPGGREAALDLRRSPAGRGRPGRAHPRHVQPDGGPHRPAVARTPPNLHNIPVRTEDGPAVPAGLHPRRGLPPPGRRLQPDRAAGHRPPGRGPRPDRGVPDAGPTSTA